MTSYRTCRGCAYDSPNCDHRIAMKAALKGLGVTSIAWRCKARDDRYQPGDPIWCDTVCDYNARPEADRDEPARDWYPGVAIRNAGTKVIVYIARGAEGQYLGADYPFAPKDGSEHGFCKIPLGRVRERDATPDFPCSDCELPASRGHMPGCLIGQKQKAELERRAKEAVG